MEYDINPTVLFEKKNDSLSQLLKVDILNKELIGKDTRLLIESAGKTHEYDLGKDDLLAEGDTPSYFIRIPAIDKDITVRSVLITKDHSIEREILLKARRKWEIHLQAFTHTDFGYTDLPSNIPGEYRKSLKDVISFCEETGDFDEKSRFRWNTESGSWLELAIDGISDAEKEKLVSLIKEGQIEIQPFYEPHVSEYYDEEILHRSLYFAYSFARKNSIKITTAVTSDVPGLPWFLPQILNKSGIKYLTTAANTYMARPLKTPRPFYWESMDGSKVLLMETDNRMHYQEGPMLGFSDNYDAVLRKLPGYLADLEKECSSFEYDLLSLRAPGSFGDNTPPNISMSYIAREWNEKWEYPKIIVSTFTDYFRKFEKKYGGKIKEYRASWPNWWASCNAAAAYEAGVNRHSSSDLLQGERLHTIKGALDGEFKDYPAKEIEKIYSKMLHTHETGWGANVSVLEPYSIQSRGQRFENASLVYQVSVNSKKILETAKERFHSAGTSKDRACISVFNTMSWERSGVAEAVVPERLFDGGKTIEIIDACSGERLPFQRIEYDNYEENIHEKHLNKIRLGIRVSDVPAMGLKRLDIIQKSGIPGEVRSTDLRNEGYIENDFYKVSIDSGTGRIISIIDRELNKNIINSQSEYGFNQLVYETPARKRNLQGIEFLSQENFKSAISGNLVYIEDILKEKFKEYFNYPARDMDLLRYTSGGSKIISARSGTLFEEITIESSGDMFPMIRTRILLDNHFKKVIVKNYLFKLETLEAEAAYITFPFDIDRPIFKLNCHGGYFEPEKQQLPGSAKDWFCLQKWLDLYNEDIDITWTPIEAQLVQLGGVNTGKWLDKLEIDTASIISYILNNYWITNTPPNQGGKLWFDYHFTSNKGLFDPVRSTRFGWNSNVPLETLYCENGYYGLESKTGFIEGLPENIIIIGLKKSENGNGFVMRLLEIAGKQTNFSLSMKAEGITDAYEVSPVEDRISDLSIYESSIKQEIKSYELKTIKILLK